MQHRPPAYEYGVVPQVLRAGLIALSKQTAPSVKSAIDCCNNSSFLTRKALLKAILFSNSKGSF